MVLVPFSPVVVAFLFLEGPPSLPRGTDLDRTGEGGRVAASALSVTELVAAAAAFPSAIS